MGLSYNAGGVESFVMNYYRYLVKKGIQFDFICMYGTLAYQEEIKALGGKIYYITNVKKNPAKFRREYVKILETGLYQTVYVNMLSAANIEPLKIAHKKGIQRIIAHSHNTSAPGCLRNYLHKKNLPSVLKYATDYWACGKEAAEWLFGKAYAKQAFIIQNAIEVERYLFKEDARQAMRKELGISEGTLALGHIGRMEEQKNHTFLLEIFHAVLLEQKDAVLLLAGDGKLKAKLKEQARQLGIERQTMFLGQRDDVHLLLSAMDLFVFPSLYEGLSVTAVEAQCAGLPCIVSKGLTADTAILEPFLRLSLEKTPQEWAKAILMAEKNLHNVPDNDKIRKRMVEKGFDIQTEAEKVYRLLCEI